MGPTGFRAGDQRDPPGGEENVKGSVIEAMLPFQNGHAVPIKNVFRDVAAVA
jgi:hypothetical protein